jgi:hypothetical protein
LSLDDLDPTSRHTKDGACQKTNQASVCRAILWGRSDANAQTGFMYTRHTVSLGAGHHPHPQVGKTIANRRTKGNLGWAQGMSIL